MRNMEQEKLYKNMVQAAIRAVKQQFQEIYVCIDFGAYIAPKNYFVSYVFRTDAALEDAKQSGLTERINAYHREMLRKNGYPADAIKDCMFASNEECERLYHGNWYYYYK